MSKVRADEFYDRSGGGSPLFPKGARVTGVATATSFSGGWTGSLSVTDTTDSTSTTTGALIVSGGVGIAKSLFVGNNVTIGGTLTYEDVTNIDSVGLITAQAGLNVSGGPITVGSGITVAQAGIVTFADGSATTNGVHFGSSGDLQVYHDGTDNYIDATTGNLYLRGPADASKWIILQAHSGENSVVAKPDGTVELFFDSSKKIETAPTGAVVTGILTATSYEGALASWTLGASGTDHYTFTGIGFTVTTSDPTLNLQRGKQYNFVNASGGHPFRIQSTVNGAAGTIYSHGVTNNDAGNGTTLQFKVPFSAPDVLYYQCTSHNNMGGVIYIGNSGSSAVIGAGITANNTNVHFNKTLVEKTSIAGGTLGSNNNHSLADGMVYYCTGNESGNLTYNIRQDGSTALNTVMSVGETITTTVILVPNNSGKINTMQIDGVTQTVEEAGGDAFAAGSDGYDVYTFTIVRHGTGTTDYLVLGVLTNHT